MPAEVSIPPVQPPELITLCVTESGHRQGAPLIALQEWRWDSPLNDRGRLALKFDLEPDLVAHMRRNLAFAKSAELPASTGCHEFRKSHPNVIASCSTEWLGDDLPDGTAVPHGAAVALGKIAFTGRISRHLPDNGVNPLDEMAQSGLAEYEAISANLGNRCSRALGSLVNNCLPKRVNST